MSEAALSAKNQIVIPREARKALGVKPGDRLLVVVKDKEVIVAQKPKAYHSAMGQEVHPSGYLNEERDSWDSNLTWVAPDLEVADVAARLRAKHRLRTPDALQSGNWDPGGGDGFRYQRSHLGTTDRF